MKKRALLAAAAAILGACSQLPTATAPDHSPRQSNTSAGSGLQYGNTSVGSGL